MSTTVQYGNAQLSTRERLAQNVRAWAAFLDNAETDTSDPAVARLQCDAEAVAGEHGHTLTPWYRSERMLAVAICTSCHNAVSLKATGYGSNNDPLKWLTAGPCVPTERYVVVKSGRAHFVRDRERPALGALKMGTLAACRAVAKRLNAGPVDELAEARARVARAQAALRRAEAALALISPTPAIEPVPSAPASLSAARRAAAALRAAA